MTTENDHSSEPLSAKPVRQLSLFDGICIIVGVIIGAGIFRSVPVVAANVVSPQWLLIAWLAGGTAALVGALVFAELTTAYPRAGGDYVYLSRAFGGGFGFLFVWSEFWLVRTGNIGLMAITFAAYASKIFPLDWKYKLGQVTDEAGVTTDQFADLSMLPYAVGVVIVLTISNVLGVKSGKTVQNVLSVTKVVGLAMIVILALLFGNYKNLSSSPTEPDTKNKAVQNDNSNSDSAAATGDANTPAGDSNNENTDDSASPEVPTETPPEPIVKGQTLSAFLFAMIFVMFTFGGWNDIAFVAAEVKQPKINLFRCLVFGVLLVTLIYVLINIAYVLGLGLEGVAKSNAVAAEMVDSLIGSNGEMLISILVCIACLGAINAMIFTGARIYYATGKDHSIFRWLGTWNDRLGGPVRSLICQSFVAISLITICGIFSDGFERLVAVTSPIFYLFFTLVSIGFFVLRYRDADVERPFRVPLFPIIPIMFMLCCMGMLYATLNYAYVMKFWTETAILGIVMVSGIIIYLIKPLDQIPDAK